MCLQIYDIFHIFVKKKIISEHVIYHQESDKDNLKLVQIVRDELTRIEHGVLA